jgi:hypothetical protein
MKNLEKFPARGQIFFRDVSSCLEAQFDARLKFALICSQYSGRNSMQLSNITKILRANASVLTLLFIPITARADIADSSTGLSAAKTEAGVCRVQGDCYGSIFTESFQDGDCAVTMTTGCDCNGNCCTVVFMTCLTSTGVSISIDFVACP